MTPDLVVLFEHPEWQKPLFSALERRGVGFERFDLKRAAFDPDASRTRRSTSTRPAPAPTFAATPALFRWRSR